MRTDAQNYPGTKMKSTSASVLDQGHWVQFYLRAGVIGSDVRWLECPACNALTWVITVTE